jgi:hypothetical protein
MRLYEVNDVVYGISLGLWLNIFLWFCSEPASHGTIDQRLVLMANGIRGWFNDP